METTTDLEKETILPGDWTAEPNGSAYMREACGFKTFEKRAIFRNKTVPDLHRRTPCGNKTVPIFSAPHPPQSRSLEAFRRRPAANSHQPCRAAIGSTRTEQDAQKP